MVAVILFKGMRWKIELGTWSGWGGENERKRRNKLFRVLVKVKTTNHKARGWIKRGTSGGIDGDGVHGWVSICDEGDCRCFQTGYGRVFGPAAVMTDGHPNINLLWSCLNHENLVSQSLGQ